MSIITPSGLDVDLLYTLELSNAAFPRHLAAVADSASAAPLTRPLPVRKLPRPRVDPRCKVNLH